MAESRVTTSPGGGITIIDESEPGDFAPPAPKDVALPLPPKPPPTAACACGAVGVALTPKGTLSAHSRGLVAGAPKCKGSGKPPLPAALSGSKAMTPAAGADTDAEVLVDGTGQAHLPLDASPPARIGKAGIVGGANRITSVRTTIKGGAGLYGLSPLVALVGPNFSGKTTVLDAIRLALTGTHPIGPRRIFELAPVDATELFAEVVATWGSASANVIRKADGTITKIKHDANIPGGKPTKAQLALTIPALSIGEMLGWGDKKIRDAVFRRFGADDVTYDTIPGLPEDAEKLWRALLESAATGAMVAEGLGADDVDLSAVDLCANAIEAARGERLRLNAEAKQREDEYERRRAEVAAHGDVNPRSLTEAEAKLAAAQTYSSVAGLAERIAAVRADVAAVETAARAAPALAPMPEPLDEEAEEAEETAEVDAAWTRMQAVSKKLAAAQAAVAKAEGTLAGLTLRDDGSCPVCETEGVGEHVETRRAALAEKIEKARVFVAALAKDHAEATRAVNAARGKRPASDAAQAWAAALAEHNRTKAQRAALKANVVAARGRLAELTAMQAAAPADPGVTVEAAKTRLAALRGAQAHLGDLAKLQTQAMQLRQTALSYGVIEKEGGRVLSEALARVAATAADAVNVYLPPDKQARLVLEENGRRICRWSIVGTDGQPHGEYAASGSEWSVLVTALSLAWPESVGPRYVLLDDAELGPIQPPMLRELLTLLAEHTKAGAVSQVFVALSPERADCLGADWQQVRLGSAA